MAINLVRVKIVAVLLLPYGVGITSQVTNLVNTLTVLLFVGLGPGVAKFLASHREAGDEAAAARVVTTSTTALLVTSLAGLAAGLVLAAPLAGWALQDISTSAARSYRATRPCGRLRLPTWPVPHSASSPSCPWCIGWASGVR